jgi:tRNA threonylcarbamoyladenosine biosynthesis protein TsaE
MPSARPALQSQITNLKFQFSNCVVGMREVVTHSPEETIDFGRSLADAALLPPKLVLLRGSLGAGKTTLVKGIAEAFAAAPAEEVTSPTFTLVHEYRGPRVTVYHVDLYRIDTERELATLGLEDMFEPSNILLIEWGEKFPRLLRDRDVEISIERLGETERKISVITES